MLRQRFRLGGSRLAGVGKVFTALLALALIFYGIVVAVLVVGVSPAVLNRISGYRTAYDFLAGLGPGDFGTTTRLIVGAAGLVAAIVFGYLAWKQIPRPRRTRTEVVLRDTAQGIDSLSPRALERAAEVAALESAYVSSVAGRLDDDDLAVNVQIHQAGTAADALEDVQRRVRDALERHEIPAMPVNVTLTGLVPQRGRELS
jgi:hypothetical protein